MPTQVIGRREKQPADVLDYDVLLDDWLPENDEVVSVTVTASPEGLDIPPTNYPQPTGIGTPARRVKIWIGGGEDGELYKVTATVTTEGDRILEIDWNLLVLEA